MKKISKDYWGNEILICGVTKADNMYYRRLYNAFTKAGVKVYGLPTNPESNLNFNTYADLDALDHIPECAYILCDKEDEPELVKELEKRGVKRILVFSNGYASDAMQKYCEEHGMEVRAGCPLMLYNGATCALHAMVAGVADERKK